MGFLSRFSTAKYDDAKIVALATRAIEEDPVIENPGRVIATSEKGVVTLSGSVYTDTQMRHVEGAVNGALKAAGLRYAEIADKLVVAR